MIDLRARPFAAAHRLHGDASREQHDAEELHEAVVADIGAFTDTIGMWPAEPMLTVRVYTGGQDTARTDMRTLVQAHRQAEAAERAARDELGEALNNVRNAAAERRWRDLDAPVAARGEGADSIRVAAHPT